MTTARFSAHIYRASGHGNGVTIASGEAARRGVFLSQAMQGEEDALAQDHARDGRLGERDAGPDLDGSQRCHRLGVGVQAGSWRG
jgi:hypothetical protein